MPKIVKLRDLPGGPIPVEFSDELPHWNTCTKCGMISTPMYEDEQHHVFCDECVQEASKDSRIFCKVENRNVSLENFIEAHQWTIALRNLKLYCPNTANGCREMCTLGSVKDHYTECIYTTIACTVCKLKVKGTDYSTHLHTCAPPYVQCSKCLRGMTKQELQAHVCNTGLAPDKHHRNNSSPCPTQYSTPRAFEVDDLATSNLVKGTNACTPFAVTPVDDTPRLLASEVKSMYQLPVDTFPSGHKATGKVSPSIMSEGKQKLQEEKRRCELCKNKVKLSLWNKHREHCENQTVTCIVCQGQYPRVCIEEHRTTCQQVYTILQEQKLGPVQNGTSSHPPSAAAMLDTYQGYGRSEFVAPSGPSRQPATASPEHDAGAKSAVSKCPKPATKAPSSRASTVVDVPPSKDDAVHQDHSDRSEQMMDPTQNSEEIQCRRLWCCCCSLWCLRECGCS